MRITKVASTDLFCGTAAKPLQVVRVSLANDGPGMVRDPTAVIRVSVFGAGVVTPEPGLVTGIGHGEQRTVEVGVEIAAPAPVGSPRQVDAVAFSPSGRGDLAGQI